MRLDVYLFVFANKYKHSKQKNESPRRRARLEERDSPH